MTDKLAPIVLFVYNRPDHTKLTIEALQKNSLAKESELFIYSDAAKNEESRKSVEDVRTFLKAINGFKTITVIEREKNWGLANSIIDGVTNVVNKYGKIIVLEDDLVASPYFLKFMNDALDIYNDKKKVWHVSGWNPPLISEKEAYLWRGMNCWGWATWADRWEHYEKNVDELLHEFSKQDINRFNIDKTVPNFWEQVVANKMGQIDTWAIFWYATIFRENGLCLNPIHSYVQNIGMDGSGVHCDIMSEGHSELNAKLITSFPDLLIEDEEMIEKVKIYNKKKLIPFHMKVINRLKRLLDANMVD